MEGPELKYEGGTLSYTADVGNKINYIMMLSKDVSYDEVASKIHSFTVNAPTAADYIISQLLRGVSYREIKYPF